VVLQGSSVLHGRHCVSSGSSWVRRHPYFVLVVPRVW